MTLLRSLLMLRHVYGVTRIVLTPDGAHHDAPPSPAIDRLLARQRAALATIADPSGVVSVSDAIQRARLDHAPDSDPPPPPPPACAPEPPPPPPAARRAGQGRARRACDVELLPPRPTSAPRAGAQEPPGVDALLARLPEPTAADLRDAPVEWLEMVDWDYVARMARMKPAGWMHAVGVHLAIRRLYHWRDAIIAAAEAAWTPTINNE